ncbi:Uncharacterised protein [uncultured archaeon]|nr:Uncharacterised protein [uncultured archaeon]
MSLSPANADYVLLETIDIIIIIIIIIIITSYIY